MEDQAKTWVPRLGSEMQRAQRDPVSDVLNVRFVFHSLLPLGSLPEKEICSFKVLHMVMFHKFLFNLRKYMYVNVDCKENSSMHFSISNNVTFLWLALWLALACP